MPTEKPKSFLSAIKDVSEPSSKTEAIQRETQKDTPVLPLRLVVT